MRKVAFLIAASPNAAFFSQLAAFSQALRRLEWQRWSPSLLVCFGEGLDGETAALYARWRRLFPDAAIVFAPENVPNQHYHKQMDGLFRWAPKDADVLVRVDADTLPIDTLEPMLDLVLERSAIAGTVAHYRFPSKPGVSNRAAWLSAAEGLIEQPFRFDYVYTLASTELPLEERETPFYLNDGCVFFARDYFEQFAPLYLELRPQLMQRLWTPWFAGQAALALAVARIPLPAIALPLRYNFPNDEIAARRYPEELENVKVVHYLRTTEIDREAIFQSAEQYQAFLTRKLNVANTKFRNAVRSVFGDDYPFAAEPPPLVTAAVAEVAQPQEPPPVWESEVINAELKRNTPAALMNVKRLLVSKLGQTEAFAKYRQLAALPMDLDLSHKSLMGQADYAKRHAAEFVVTHPGGKPFRVPPIPIIGEGRCREVVSVSRQTHVACIEGAVVRGRSEIIEVDHHALLDFHDEELDWFDCNFDVDPAIFSGDRHSVWLVSSESDPRRRELAEAFSFLGLHVGAFGDFMMQYLPRYIWAEMSGALPRVPVLVNDRMPRSITEAIRLFVPSGVDLIPVERLQPVKVGRLWSASTLTYAAIGEVMDGRYAPEHAFPCPDLMRVVVKELQRRVAPHVDRAPAPERLYLARRPSRWRRLVNAEAIEAVAQEEGFRVVYPEALDFMAQVNLLANASHVVAPEGSALYLCYFSNPGLKVCILQHPFFEDINVYKAFLEHCDITCLMGPVARRDPIYPHRSDYSIDSQRFRDFLGSWNRS